MDTLLMMLDIVSTLRESVPIESIDNPLSKEHLRVGRRMNQFCSVSEPVTGLPPCVSNKYNIEFKKDPIHRGVHGVLLQVVQSE